MASDALVTAELVASTWLELLPYEALRTILEALCDWYEFSSPIDEMYTLASVSQQLRKAVQRFLDHTASLTSEVDITNVHRLFPSGAKRVMLTFCTTDHPAVPTLLQNPELRMAAISADEHLTTALLIKKSVMELDLSMDDRNHGGHIIALLRALRLIRLKINCYVNSPAKCCLSNLALSNPEHENSIPSICPDLELLEVTCTRDKNNAIFFRLLPHLRLRKAQLRGHVRKAALIHLRDMESVELLHVYQTVFHAERIGESVICIESFEKLDRQDLDILRGCPRLETLDVDVNSVDIDELFLLLRGLEGLRKLRMRFNNERSSSGKRRRQLESLPQGAVVKLFTSAPLLQDIGLSGVKVSLGEMVETIQLIGERLRHFSSDLKGQDEGMFERMESLLGAMYRSCPSIEHISFREYWSISSIRSQLRRKGKDYAKRRKQQKEIGKTLVALINSLKRRTRWREGSDQVTQLVEMLL